VPDEAPGDPCDYPLTRPFAITLAALAARTVSRHVLSGESWGFEITWEDLRITQSQV
jgi:hypothetical protein